jgi:AcrR family transcriptional regulator
MARLPQPHIRARLREQAVRYVLTHGISNLALRPLAKALKTNARMLVYHFESREGLMREILLGLRELGDSRIREWFGRSEQSRTLSDFLRWYWKGMSAPAARPALRLTFELYALALRRPKDYPGVLEDPLAYWKGLTKKTSWRPQADEAMATLLLAATRGLLLDLCATGDRARTERALRLLARLLESKADRRQSQRHRSKPKRVTSDARSGKQEARSARRQSQSSTRSRSRRRVVSSPAQEW